MQAHCEGARASKRYLLLAIAIRVMLVALGFRYFDIWALALPLPFSCVRRYLLLVCIVPAQQSGQAHF
jgi:hypothetical protein